MKRIHYILLVGCCALAAVLTSCEKVSPIGILVSGTGVEDRVKMSNIYYKEHKGDLDNYILFDVGDGDEYTFLVGSDSHMTDDPGRMDEMFKIGIDNNDLLYAHLGDIADTKAEYYINLAKGFSSDSSRSFKIVDREGKKVTSDVVPADSTIVVNRNNLTANLAIVASVLSIVSAVLTIIINGHTISTF